MPPDTRDEVVDYIDKWTVRAEIAAKQLLAWMGLPTSKFHLWRKHYGRPHAHNSHIPRDGWLDAWEKQAIVDFHRRFPLEGYRRLAFMMLDPDVVAVSPSSVFRVLKGAGLLDRNKWTPSKKGTGFVQPLKAHEHWHALLVAAGEQRVERQRILVGRGLGLLDEHAEHPPLVGVERPDLAGAIGHVVHASYFPAG